MALKNKLETLVTVFGGSGFVGRHVVRALANRGYRIRVAVRRPELGGYLRPMGRVGQIQTVQANLRYPDSVAAAVRDADAVVNLVGILFERGRQRFDTIMAEGAGTVARAASRCECAAGSHLGDRRRREFTVALCAGQGGGRTASARRAKHGGDRASFRSSSVRRTISSIALRRWRGLRRRCRSSAAATPACSRSLPATLAKPSPGRWMASLKPGAIYEAGGPDVRTFKELMEFVLGTIGRRRLLLPVPFGLMKFKAAFLQYLPKPPITPDQVALLERDNVVSDDASRDGRTLEGIGITPESMQAIVPTYLWRFRKTGQFSPHAA